MKTTTNIIVDARGAGQGKTTTGIYPQILKLHQLGERALIVVPSKHLQNEYRNQLPNINFELINSDGENSDRVSVRLLQALESDAAFILITSEAFKNTRLRLDHKNLRHLIIDEAIMPYDFREVQLDERLKFGLDQVFYPHTQIHSHCWNLLSRNSFEANTILDESPTWRRLTHANSRVWCDYDSWCKITGTGDVSTNKLYFGIELDPVVVANWRSVFIAAAAFDRTFMASWLLKNGLEYKTIRPFVPHLQVPVFHSPERFNKRGNYSRNFRQQNPALLDEFYAYVQKTIGVEPCLGVRNNDELRGLFNEDVEGNSRHKLSHNAHGINKFRDHTNIYLVSSLNFSPKMNEFLEDQWHQINFNQQFKEWVTQANAGYTYYQLIMRTALRVRENTKPVNVFLIDRDIHVSLQDFFDVQQQMETAHHTIALTQFAAKKPKKVPLTQSERNKRAYEKRKLQALINNPSTNP